MLTWVRRWVDWLFATGASAGRLGEGGGFVVAVYWGHSTALSPLAHRRCHFTMRRLLRSGLPVCPSFFLGFSRICFSFIFCFDVSQCLFESYISLASRLYFAPCRLYPMCYALEDFLRACSMPRRGVSCIKTRSSPDTSIDVYTLVAAVHSPRA